MRMFGIAQNMVGLIQNNIKQRKTVLTTGGEALGEVHIRRGIFQGDSLSSLLCDIGHPGTNTRATKSKVWV